jgi:ribosomal protein L30/L7E
MTAFLLNQELQVVLKRSLIGQNPSIKKTLMSLGLKKVGQVKIISANACSIGQMNKVLNCLEVTPLDNNTKK